MNTQRAHATAENCIKHIILINYMCDTVSAKLSQPICMNASIKPLWTSSDSFFSLENTLLILEAIQRRQAGDKVISPNILITSQSYSLCQVHRVQQWFELVCLFHSVTYTVTWKICECVPQPEWCTQSCVRSIAKKKKKVCQFVYSLYWNTQKVKRDILCLLNQVNTKFHKYK